MTWVVILVVLAAVLIWIRRPAGASPSRPPTSPARAVVAPELPPGVLMTPVDHPAIATRIAAWSEIREQPRAPDGTAMPERYYRLTLTSGTEAIVQHVPGYDWINVYCAKRRKADTGPSTGDMAQYGFSVSMSRWSFGDGPHGARQIRAALRTLEPSIQGRER
jgi:hypothetical protein